MAKLLQATVAYRALEQMGYYVDVSERRVSKIVSKDLFGAFDLVAVMASVGIVGVQVTSSSHLADRRRKVLESSPVAEWLAAGGFVDVVGIDHIRHEMYRCKAEEITRSESDVLSCRTSLRWPSVIDLSQSEV